MFQINSCSVESTFLGVRHNFHQCIWLSHFFLSPLYKTACEKILRREKRLSNTNVLGSGTTERTTRAPVPRWGQANSVQGTVGTLRGPQNEWGGGKRKRKSRSGGQWDASQATVRSLVFTLDKRGVVGGCWESGGCALNSSSALWYIVS